jgi:AraC-like DNA-binding protein
VRRYLRRLLGDLRSGAPAGPDLADGLLDLFAGLYDGTVALPRPPEALRMLARGFIDEQLADPALGPDVVADAHFISRRQLDRLFAATGRTVSETIRQRRLERCRRDLGNPALADRSILEIATAHGFVSAAHFSRTFRAAYGLTPRELRGQTKMRPPSTTTV